ncbi:MAG TPA: NUDIX domain-containing protein [Dehalococcoidia bacterium]|nr:NUDIX domain-containing protein [Dehalococcoidia bacterium]
MAERAPQREVAVGFIVADDGRMLLQHRDDKPGLPSAGMWGFFGGHVEPGETPEQAFLREMDEELGWRPRHLERFGSVVVEHGPRHVVSHRFAAHLDVPVASLRLREGQDLGLFAPEALPPRIVPEIVPAIEQFARGDVYRRVRRAWDAISVTAILVGPDGRFLLQHRDDKPEIMNPGLWGSFGGEVEPHETPETALVRELREELDWAPPSYALVEAGPARVGDALLLIYVYAAPVEAPLATLTLGEGQGMAYFALADLPDTTVPAYRDLLGRFAASPLFAEMVRKAATHAA